MSDKKTLQDIFNDDPFDLLKVKPASTPARNEDERLVSSFQEIADFYEKNNREPQLGGGIQEHQYHSRLKGIRSDPSKMSMLKPYDKYGLLDYEAKEVNSINDILDDDIFGLLDDDSEGLFDLKHIKKQEDRASTDFVARRKHCKDFDKYEAIFKDVQKDLSGGKRKLMPFKQEILQAGDFFVHNGVLLLLEKVDFEEGVQQFRSGSRFRKDGRTRVIFENGTESNMLYRSLYKALLDNGKAVSEHVDKVNEKFVEKFSNISEEDKEAGFIYVLKSKSDKQEIKEIEHLYKIGYSKVAVEERVKNASQEPTYLMAPVSIITAFKCYNMNPQKFELLIHTFFSNSCLNIDIFDSNKQRHTPREWFIAPIDVIQQAIQFIISGEIVNYRYDSTNKEIILR